MLQAKVPSTLCVVQCTAAVPSIGSDCVYIGLFVFLMCGALVFFFISLVVPFFACCERTRIKFEISFLVMRVAERN